MRRGRLPVKRNTEANARRYRRAVLRTKVFRVFRRVVGSFWTVAGLLLTAIILHIRWYTVDKVSGAEALSGFGSTLVVLGVLLASRPYLRAGIGRLVYDSFSAIGPFSYPGDTVVRQQLDRIRVERPKVVVDVWTERVIAVLVVMIGTLLNGYAPLVARLLHLRGL